MDSECKTMKMKQLISSIELFFAFTNIYENESEYGSHINLKK